MNKLFKALDQFLWLGSVLNLCLLVSVVLLQVFARVALPQAPAWTEEASRFFFIWTVGFAAGPAVRERAYVDVDSFTTHLPAKAQLYLAILIDLLLFCFSAVMAYEASKLFVNVAGQTSAALLWPMRVFYAAVLLQTSMLTLYLARSVAWMIRTGKMRHEEFAGKEGDAI